jgi:hypothetical protein
MDFIYEDDEAIPNALCDKLVEFFEKNREIAEDGCVAIGDEAKVIKSYKKNQELFLNDTCTSEIEDIYQCCIKSLKRYLKHLHEKSIDKPNSISHSVIQDTICRFGLTTPKIQKNIVGSFFDWHADYDIVNEKRIIHFIFYLSDLDDDAGGETEFSTGRVVKPKKGKVLIFPCTFFHVHRGKPVLKGIKYILNVLAVEPNIQN